MKIKMGYLVQIQVFTIIMLWSNTNVRLKINPFIKNICMFK